MKMKRTNRLDGRGYSALVGSNRVTINNTPMGRWRFYVHESGTVYAAGVGARRGCNTLQDAKKSATLTWIQLQLNNVRELVQGSLTENDRKEFNLLINEAWTGTNELACCVLSDWLCDHGKPDMLKRRIIDPGNKAKLVWPVGWEALSRVVTAQRAVIAIIFRR